MFCGVGCGIYLEAQGGEISGVYPSMSHPANEGRICVRGWHVHEVASSPDRLRTPMIRKNGALTPVSFDEAYDFIAQNLSRIVQSYGPDSIGFLNSSRCANEDCYLFQKLARSVIGTNNVDQGTSYYRTLSVEILRKQLGIPAATSSIRDIFASKVIMLNEIDVGQQLPTIGGHIIRAKLGGSKLIVVGQRRHRVAEHADLFLHTKPDTSGFLYAAMAKIIIDRGLCDREFIQRRCGGFEEFLKTIQSFDILFAARECDIDPALIEEAALMYAGNTPGLILYGAGSEKILDNAISGMVNLMLLTGNIGKAGSGLIPLAEHNNAQGGCDMGVMPRYLPGYVPVDDEAGRSSFERHWGKKLSTKPGLNSLEILAQNTRCKALWLDRHNPVVSATYLDAGEVIKRLEFVVVQNLFLTRTAELAHVVLPVAAYGEEEVTYTSTDRRIQRAVKVIEQRATLPSAWQQVAAVANRMGASWNYASSAEVMKEIAATVPQYQAVTHESLSHEYGRQWPCTTVNPLGTPLLHRRGGEGSAIFNFVKPGAAPPRALTDAGFPYVLLFGHSLYYWHQNMLVRHSETLKREYGILLLDYPEGFVEINPEDAKKLSIRDAQKITLVAPEGKADTYARVTAEVRQGIIYVPFFLQDVMRSIGRDFSGHGGTSMHVRIEKAV
jgi:predicted molibdopterin-dependent oxidoreductase YjgC